MFYFKACPRCRGDMYLDSDSYGMYKTCLQCGYEVDVTDISETTGVSSYDLEKAAATAA